MGDIMSTSTALILSSDMRILIYIDCDGLFPPPWAGMQDRKSCSLFLEDGNMELAFVQLESIIALEEM